MRLPNNGEPRDGVLPEFIVKDAALEYAPDQFGPRNNFFTEEQKDEFGKIFPENGGIGKVKSAVFTNWQQAVNEGVMPTVDYQGKPVTFDTASLFLDHARRYGPKQKFSLRSTYTGSK